jgi:hypothetical protein
MYFHDTPQARAYRDYRNARRIRAVERKAILEANPTIDPGILERVLDRRLQVSEPRATYHHAKTLSTPSQRSSKPQPLHNTALADAIRNWIGDSK